MGLEDMSMFRALPTATVFYPSDAVSTEKAVELAAITKVRQQKNPTDTHTLSDVMHTFIKNNNNCVSLHKGCLLHPHQPSRESHHLQQQ